MVQEARVSQGFTLIVGDTTIPGELDLAHSVVEFLWGSGTPTLQCGASVVEFLAERFPPSPVTAEVDPVASSFVPGPRAQLPGRPQGG